MNADPNSGYRCLVAGDDMRYSHFEGSSYEERQTVPLYKVSPRGSDNTLCWADPGPGCDVAIGAAVVCKGPREWLAGAPGMTWADVLPVSACMSLPAALLLCLCT